MLSLYKRDNTMSFDDRIVIPIFIIPFAVYLALSYFNLSFTKPPYYTFPLFLGMYVTLTIVWFFNRELLLFSRIKFPGTKNTGKRLLFETTIFLIQSSVLLVSLTYIVIHVLKLDYNGHAGHTLWDTQILNLEIALMIGMFVEATYESVYYFSIIRQAEKEKYISQQYEFFLTVIAHVILGPVKFMKTVTEELSLNGEKVDAQ